MGVKKEFVSLERFKLVRGNQITLWEDIGKPSIEISLSKFIPYRNTWECNGRWCTGLTPIKFIEWFSLVASIMYINLNVRMDTFVWGLNKNGSFTVGSMSKHQINNSIRVT